MIVIVSDVDFDDAITSFIEVAVFFFVFADLDVWGASANSFSVAFAGGWTDVISNSVELLVELLIVSSFSFSCTTLGFFLLCYKIIIFWFISNILTLNCKKNK